ncbi:MAG: T9SS type A sorting domain-containing protein [bacterium]
MPRSALAFLALPILLAAGPGSADPRLAGTAAAPDEDPLLTWLDRMGAHYDANPHLQTQRSSGWKPFSRVKWFYEQRLVDGQAPARGARWEVWRRKNERAAELGIEPRAAWFEIGPTNLSGRILDIAFDPANASVVYVGSASGGLWKSTDGGDTWSTTTDELPTLAIGGVRVSPFDSDVVIIATGEGTFNADRVGGIGILKSTDAGQTWNPTSLSHAVDSGTGFHCLEVNPSTGTWLAGANDGLWRSTDEGDTWTEVAGATSYFDVKWNPGLTHVYTASGSVWGGVQIRVSTDDGLSWSTLSSGLPAAGNCSKTKLAVTPAQPAWIYAHIVSASSYGTLGVYRSTNDGASWSARNTSVNMAGGQGWYNATIVVDPNDANRVVAGGVQNYLSTNGGTSFSETGDGYGLGTQTALHWDHHVALYEPGSSSDLWVGTDGGVWKSTNDGADWLSRREGIGTYQFYDICVAQSDAADVLGGTQDNGVPGRVGTSDWFTSNLFADGMVCNVDPTDERVVYAEWQGGNHVKSTDGGGSWFDIQSGISGGGLWVTPVDLDPNDPLHLWTESSQGMWRTTNGGASWTQRGTHSASWISISPVDGNVVWSVEGSARPRYTTNDGTSWTQAANYGFATGGSATKVHAHPADASTAFVTFSGYSAGAHVARTTNLGASWTNVTGDLPPQPVNTMVVDPQTTSDWYLGTDVGVWKSTNGGASWVPFDTALPNAVVSDLEIRDGERKLVAGTYGRGAWEISLAPDATGAQAEVAARPLNLMLDPPRPNPVRDAATLRFAARHDGPVTLAVFDVAGRLVTPVVELPHGDGVIRTAPWLADRVPNGVYFVVLAAGEARVTEKIVVMR